MLMVKTYLAKSTIQGIGLFAAEMIPKGTIIWKFQKNFDQRIPREVLNSLSEYSQQQVENYGYLDTDTDEYILCSDDARFINDSGAPNTEVIDSEDNYGYVIADRDIQKDEEIIENYHEYEGFFHPTPYRDRAS